MSVETRPDRGGFVRRLGVYLVGVSIGLVMVGMMHQARQARMAAQRAQSPEAGTPQGKAPIEDATPGVGASDGADGSKAAERTGPGGP